MYGFLKELMKSEEPGRWEFSFKNQVSSYFSGKVQHKHQTIICNNKSCHVNQYLFFYDEQESIFA